MTATADPAQSTNADSRRSNLKRVSAAAAIGNFVEWFDSAAYAVMSVTIAKLFFPDYSTTASLMAVWAIFAGGFIARPLGAAFFGRYGDRIGRNKMLGLCVLIMSAATFGIGILPTYAVIGIWAPLMLFVFRAIQGFTTGGEYTGSSAFIVEYAPANKRATFASIIPMTVGLASVAGALVGVLITSTLSPEALDAWGWRIPFLLAAPLGLIGLYIRSRVDDTPVFRSLENQGEVTKHPMREAWQTCRRQIFTLFGYSITNAVAYYLMSSYMIAYMTKELDYTSTESMITSVATMIVYSLACPLAARMSDKFGRRRMLLFACVGFVVVTVPAFLLMPLGLGFAILSTSILGANVAVIGTSNVPALVEMFPSSVRSSGSAIGYTLAYVLFGGTAPFVATGLVAVTGTAMAPAFYLVVIALISAVVVAFFFRETKHLSLHRKTVL